MAASGPVLWDLTCANSRGAAGCPHVLVLCCEFCSGPVPLQLKLFKGCFIVAAFNLKAQSELLDSYHLGTQLFTEEARFPFPQLTLPLSLTANMLLCQHFRCLLPCIVCGRRAQLLNTHLSLSLCAALKDKGTKACTARQGFSPVPCRLDRGMWT